MLSWQELKTIFLWSLLAFLPGFILYGPPSSFLDGFTNGIYWAVYNLFNFMPYWAIYLFCAFSAVTRLRGKTKLSGLIISLYMSVIVLVLGTVFTSVVSSSVFYFEFDFLLTLFGIGLGVIAFPIGGYLADKRGVKPVINK